MENLTASGSLIWFWLDGMAEIDLDNLPYYLILWPIL